MQIKCRARPVFYKCCFDYRSGHFERHGGSVWSTDKQQPNHKVSIVHAVSPRTIDVVTIQTDSQASSELFQVNRMADVRYLQCERCNIANIGECTQREIQIFGGLYRHKSRFANLDAIRVSNQYFGFYDITSLCGFTCTYNSLDTKKIL